MADVEYANVRERQQAATEMYHNYPVMDLRFCSYHTSVPFASPYLHSYYLSSSSLLMRSSFQGTPSSIQNLRGLLIETIFSVLRVLLKANCPPDPSSISCSSHSVGPDVDGGLSTDNYPHLDSLTVDSSTIPTPLFLAPTECSILRLNSGLW